MPTKEENVPDSVRGFFEELPTRADASKAAGMNASYLFDVDGAGEWTVRVTDGTVAVDEGPGEAECTILVSEDNFLKLLNRELNPMTAYMTGKLKVRGDMGAAMNLQKLF